MDTASAKTVIEFVLQTLTIIVTPILVMIAHKLTSEFSKRTGLAVADQQAAMLDDAVMKGISYAHEQSRKALKLISVPLQSGDKRDVAVDFVLNTLKEHKVPEKGRDYVARLVESRLNLDRGFPEILTPDA